MATQPHWFPVLSTPNILTIHLSEKTSRKWRTPLLRAKTLPAILTPGLTVSQAAVESSGKPLIIHTGDVNAQSRALSAKRNLGSSVKRGSTGSEKWHLLGEENSSPENSFSSASSITSQMSGTKDIRSEHGGSRAGLSKLARLLVPRDKASSHGSEGSLTHDASSLRKATSIDSLLVSSSSACNLDLGAISPVVPSPSGDRTLPSSPSVPTKLESHKGSRNETVTPAKSTKGSEERIGDCSPLTKAERKRLQKINIDLQALFAAVEHGQLERARSILQSTDVDVNSVNSDGFTPLDVAVLTCNTDIVQLLQSHGATESPKGEGRECQLQLLLRETCRCLEDLEANSTLLHKEKERQLSLWQRRHQLLNRMKAGFDQLRVPDPPLGVQLEVVGNRALKIKFSEPGTAHQENSIVTKYKVEWSCFEDFGVAAGCCSVIDMQQLEVTIPDLTQGGAYFVRVAAGNPKGFSAWTTSSPLSATPSGWRDVEDHSSRYDGLLVKMDDLFNKVMNSRSEPSEQQRRQVRKGIKYLFAWTSKFQKSIKRGVHLACLMYDEDRIAVTAEDTLPIIEVDETYPSPLHTDFHWLLKVACTWKDVKTLRQDIERSHSASNLHFRSKLLQAVEQMQVALGFQDLGQLHHEPLKDSEGTMLLCTVKHIRDPKSMVALSLRWLPLQKLQRKGTTDSDGTTGDTAINDLLIKSLQEMVAYHQVSTRPLPRGLYVGYMKLKSSVDAIRVVVPKLTPNILPHIKVRDNPHVSREEWQRFKDLSASNLQPSEVQLKLQTALSAAIKQLLESLSIQGNVADSHRFYDVEVVELSDDVSLLLVLPPVEEVCTVPGQSDEVDARFDCIQLPVQIFEMNHMMTYQPNLVGRYSRLSSILEMDSLLAQHAQREAFSSVELSEAKSRLSQLRQYQAEVDALWRASRWIMDVLAFARDRQATNGIPLRNIWIHNSESATVPEATRPSSRGRPLRRSSSTSHLENIGRTENEGLRTLSAERMDDLNRTLAVRLLLSADDRIGRKEGVIRVYAAYETGLPNGTSVKLHVTPQTTAREVVDLVVKQLSMAVVLKGRGGPIYEGGHAFCLVATAGTRERRLADDFRPLGLQGPWSKGRLLVRRRSDS